MTGSRIARVAALSAMLLTPAVAWAQSEIAGVVRDSTGGVLPGVSVEASSPVLIEKVRTVVTDGEGLYKIIDLRPGVYVVTFTLPGFSTVRREGLELAASFTATVNAELRVGAVEETITVAGSSPIVDVQNVRSQTVVSREVLDTLPTAKNMAGYAAITVGASSGQRDVGGQRGEQYAQVSIHGSRSDGKVVQDNLQTNGIYGTGGNHFYKSNHLATEEMVFETGANNAEYETGGVMIKIVPRAGGNRFTGSFISEYTNENFSNTSVPDDLSNRGAALRERNAVREVYDNGFGLGGPILRDKLWFYTAHRIWGSSEYFANLYFNRTQDTMFYTPELDQQGYDRTYYRNNELRLTWQATTKQKIAVHTGYTWGCGCYYWQGVAGGVLAGHTTSAPEAGVDFWFPVTPTTASWNYVRNNRLLFEANVQYQTKGQDTRPTEGTNYVRGVTRPILETTTGMLYGAAFHPSGAGWEFDYGNQGTHKSLMSRFAVSYVTGSHALKAGISNTSGEGPGHADGAANEAYIFTAGKPIGLYSAAFPVDILTKLRSSLGVFAQDQWTVKRMTLTAGLRFDYLNAYNPAQVRPAGFYLPEISFAEDSDLPNWKDISPRIGVAYDLFGNGRTAVKAFAGRYVAGQFMRIAQDFNKVNTISYLTQRTWGDSDNDYVPDCDLKNQAANGECGPGSNSAFGTQVITADYDPDARIGWGKRGYSWQYSASVQHELRPGLGILFAYYRTTYGNQTLVDNTRVTDADYDSYCITAPVDSRLPDGGGYQVCGLYDIKPEKFGQVFNRTTLASNFGEHTEVYNGVDVIMNARFGTGGLLMGGFNTGKTTIDRCDQPDFAPQFCDQQNPWANQTQVKFSGSYPLPWGIATSVVFQNLPGVPWSASYVATNAQILPSLGRNLGQCRGAALCNGTAVVNLLPPNEYREPRYSQLDLRLSKLVNIRQVKVTPKFDIYNLTNSGPITALFTRYAGATGGTWLNAQGVLTGRLFKFGVQVDF